MERPKNTPELVARMQGITVEEARLWLVAELEHLTKCLQIPPTPAQPDTIQDLQNCIGHVRLVLDCVEFSALKGVSPEEFSKSCLELIS